MNEKLSHLTEEQIQTLIDRYYTGEKIVVLKKDYDLKIKESNIAKYFPPEILDIQCKYCGTNFIRPQLPRGNLKWTSPVENCPNCKHENNESCTCWSCMEIYMAKLKIENQQKQDFNDLWLAIDEDKKIDYHSLTSIDKIYLGALLREGISEDYSYIKPVGSFINPLTPRDEFTTEIISRLKAIKAIVIHQGTDPEFIEIINYENGDFAYYTHNVKWSLNIKSNELNNVQLIESLINPKDLEDSQYEEAFQIWKKIALYESIEYFKYSVAKVFSIDYEIGEKTITVLSELINYYSVAQICCIIYKTTNDALRYRVEKGVSTRQAANSIMGKAQSYGERARINNWNILKSYRSNACPESALSKFFFGRIIKIGYEGFSEIPDISKIQGNISESVE